jgi:FolB domain-containing protein
MDSATYNDVVFVNSLQASLNLGVDCWSKNRPQPACISVYLHLQQSFLDRAGKTDDVQDSVHYGHLAKAITMLIEERGPPFDGIRGVVEAITKEAFKLAGEAVTEVRVVVDLPKLILLATGFSVDVVTSAPTLHRDVPTKVFVKGLTLATIIGVNPPEREAKQRVITNIVFHEKPGDHSPVDYAQIVSKISRARISQLHHQPGDSHIISYYSHRI